MSLKLVGLLVHTVEKRSRPPEGDQAHQGPAIFEGLLLVSPQSYGTSPPPVLLLDHGCAGDKEIVGTLRGFDVYVNMVLEDVKEIEVTPEGKRITKLDQILLNGNSIAVLVPGGKPDDVE